MKLQKVLAILALVGATSCAFAMKTPEPATRTTAASTPSAERVIRIVEHAGYFETKDTVFNIDAGPVIFEVTNRAGKDAGFILDREGQEPLILGVKNGETGRMEAELTSGSYTYFCPIIPTPRYPMQVK